MLTHLAAGCYVGLIPFSSPLCVSLFTPLRDLWLNGFASLFLHHSQRGVFLQSATKCKVCLTVHREEVCLFQSVVMLMLIYCTHVDQTHMDYVTWGTLPSAFMSIHRKQFHSQASSPISTCPALTDRPGLLLHRGCDADKCSSWTNKTNTSPSLA